jgi:hypothetical protein
MLSALTSAAESSATFNVPIVFFIIHPCFEMPTAAGPCLRTVGA